MSLLRLPLEILREIVTYVKLQDIWTIVFTHPRLKNDLLGNEKYCSELVQKFIPSTRERSLAESSQITWRAALENLFRCQDNLAYGKPCDSLTFPAGNDFLYSDATLCVLRGRVIDIYEIHSSQAKTGLSLSQDLVHAPKGTRIKLIHYCNKTLSIRVDYAKESRLAIFRLPTGANQDLQLVLHINVPLSARDVVRSDSKNVVVGTYTQSPEGPTWRFACFSIRNGRGERLRQVGNFRSHEIASDVCFEILDGCFWIVTSQVTADPEGADPVSYYGGCRVNLSMPNSRAQYWRLWRRRQVEGPVDDSWTTLALMKDEQGRYLIAESRYEWLKPDNKQRSFYKTIFDPEPWVPAEDADPTQPLAFEDLARNTRTENFEYVETMLSLAADSFVATFRGLRHRHAENGPVRGGGRSTASAPTYRIGQTPYCTFYPLSDAFLDLVWDPLSKICPSELNLPGNRCLRLRVGGRTAGTNYNALSLEQQNEDHRAELAVKTPVHSSHATEVEYECPIYYHTPVSLYPTSDTRRKEIRRLQQAGYPNKEDYKFFSDERTLVVGMKKRRRNDKYRMGRKITLICWDPLSKWRTAREGVRRSLLGSHASHTGHRRAREPTYTITEPASSPSSEGTEPEPRVAQYESSDSEEDEPPQPTLTLTLAPVRPLHPLPLPRSPSPAFPSHHDSDASTWGLSPAASLPALADAAPAAEPGPSRVVPSDVFEIPNPADRAPAMSAGKPRRDSDSTSGSSWSGVSALGLRNSTWEETTGALADSSDDLSVKAGKKRARVEHPARGAGPGDSGDERSAAAGKKRARVERLAGYDSADDIVTEDERADLALDRSAQPHILAGLTDPGPPGSSRGSGIPPELDIPVALEMGEAAEMGERRSGEGDDPSGRGPDVSRRAHVRTRKAADAEAAEAAVLDQEGYQNSEEKNATDLSQLFGM